MNHWDLTGFQMTNGSVPPWVMGSSNRGAGARAMSMRVGALGRVDGSAAMVVTANPVNNAKIANDIFPFMICLSIVKEAFPSSLFK
jgi:hypothetical protein